MSKKVWLVYCFELGMRCFLLLLLCLSLNIEAYSSNLSCSAIISKTETVTVKPLPKQLTDHPVIGVVVITESNKRILLTGSYLLNRHQNLMDEYNGSSTDKIKKWTWAGELLVSTNSSNVLTLNKGNHTSSLWVTDKENNRGLRHSIGNTAGALNLRMEMLSDFGLEAIKGLNLSEFSSFASQVLNYTKIASRTHLDNFSDKDLETIERIKLNLTKIINSSSWDEVYTKIKNSYRGKDIPDLFNNILIDNKTYSYFLTDELTGPQVLISDLFEMKEYDSKDEHLEPSLSTLK